MPPDDEGETVALDERGRLAVPKHIRDELGLSPGEELRLSVGDGELRLRPVHRPQPKVKARRRWGKDAFVPAGEALVGDED